MSNYRLALDIGGTFADAVMHDETTGEYIAGKSSTTSGDLTTGILAAMDIPQEALLAAPAAGQELCGEAESRGRLGPGYVFDGVPLDADPSDTAVINDPATVVAVYQAGRLVHTRDEALRSSLPATVPAA